MQLAALVGLAVLASATARADRFTCPDDTGNTREMERIGNELFDEAVRREPADPRGALEMLTCVRRFADKPAVSLRIGIVAERLGNVKLAVEAFERYLALAGRAAPDRAEMQEHIDHLRNKLAPEEPKPVPSGVEPAETPPEQERHADELTGWLVAGAGLVVMAAGGVLLYSAKSRSDAVHDLEPGTTYWDSSRAKQEMDKAKREQTYGLVGLATGAAITGLGIWLALDSQGTHRATASVGPHHATAALRLAF